MAPDAGGDLLCAAEIAEIMERVKRVAIKRKDPLRLLTGLGESVARQILHDASDAIQLLVPLHGAVDADGYETLYQAELRMGRTRDNVFYLLGSMLAASELSTRREREIQHRFIVAY